VANWSTECCTSEEDNVRPPNEWAYYGEQQKGILLWIYVTGTLAADDGSEDELWFIWEGALMAISLGLRIYHEICNHLSRHLFLRTLEERNVKKISRFIKEQADLD
jgi:hypothetical protein